MTKFDPTEYGPAFAALLQEDRLMVLGPGEPQAAVQAKLEALTPQRAFAHVDAYRVDYAEACLAGLWLYYDYLEASHRISQELHHAHGSYWHAIMHRREGDYSNAKYWFRRVGDHRVFVPLVESSRWQAQSASLEPQAEFLATQEAWDPYRFVDLVERVIGDGSPTELFCRRVQLLEWHLLFDDCYRATLQM